MCIADIGLVAGRNLRKVLRNTRLIVFSTIQPLLQLILFAYVFAGVARVPGATYKNFVVPGVIVQTMVFSAMGTGVGIANDLQTGMIDRFRSLPIARSAFLVGRTVSDSLRLGIQAVLLVIAASIIGFRFHNGALPALGMVVVVVLFGMALTAFSAWLGLTLARPRERAGGGVHSRPAAHLHQFRLRAGQEPARLDATPRQGEPGDGGDRHRGLAFGGPHTTTAAWHFAAWWVVIVAVFTALAVRRYRLG